MRQSRKRGWASVAGALIFAIAFIGCSAGQVEAGGKKGWSGDAKAFWRQEQIIQQRLREQKVAAPQKAAPQKSAPQKSAKSRALMKEALKAEIEAQQKAIQVHKLEVEALFAVYVVLQAVQIAVLPSPTTVAAQTIATPAAVGAKASAEIAAIANVVELLDTARDSIDLVSFVADGVY